MAEEEKEKDEKEEEDEDGEDDLAPDYIEPRMIAKYELI